MQPLPPASGRRSRLALVAGSVIVLLGVVAFGTRSGFGHPAAQSSPSNRYVSFAFTVFVVVFVIGIPVAAWAFLQNAREGVGKKRRGFASRLLQNLATVAVFGFAAFGLYYLRHHRWHGLPAGKSPLAKLARGLGGKHANRPGAQAYTPTFEWWVVWVAVAIGLVAAGLVLESRRRRKSLPAASLPEPTLAEDFAASIGDALDDLEAEPDARRAVIAAYARMEGVLARHGLRRAPSETALEYLQRVLLGLTTRGDSVERLTALFEEAKFSRHEVDAGMKNDAIDALREIRDGL